MIRLRDPETGCPWDAAQDFASIAPYTIEEAYEVADAIQIGDRTAIRDELGDLLLQVVFHSRIAEEEGSFTLEDVANAVDATVQETALFSRNMAPTALDHPAVLEAAFSSELIEEGVNSDIIEIDDETVVVVRVVEHEPQRTQSLEEVREGIVASLQDQKAQEAAQAWARERVNQLQKGESIDDALAEKSLNWEAAEGIAREHCILLLDLFSTASWEVIS